MKTYTFELVKMESHGVIEPVRKPWVRGKTKEMLMSAVKPPWAAYASARAIDELTVGDYLKLVKDRVHPDLRALCRLPGKASTGEVEAMKERGWKKADIAYHEATCVWMGRVVEIGEA